MAEVDGYWGEGYYGEGYWGEGYWGKYGAAAPAIDMSSTSRTYGKPPKLPWLDLDDPETLELLIEFVEVI